MKNRLVNKVKVVKEFPGFFTNDVLTLNKSTGLFEYSYNDKVEEGKKFLDGVNSAFEELTQYKPSLSKEQVVKGMNEYFEDVSEYLMKDKEWIQDRIVELRDYISKIDIDDKEGVLPDSVNVKEAKTVWQNIIWELETVLGQREQYRSDL